MANEVGVLIAKAADIGNHKKQEVRSWKHAKKVWLSASTERYALYSIHWNQPTICGNLPVLLIAAIHKHKQDLRQLYLDQ
jgi:hypothetical protein